MRTKYTTTAGKGHQYVGVRVEDGEYERFQAWGTPVRETHGDHYIAVIGPFKTVRGWLYLSMGPNGDRLLRSKFAVDYFASQ